MPTWVIGDVHGCYNEFQKLLSKLKLTDNDKVILIGDIIDRGPDVYKMIKWAMDNITIDGKYQMILGNHEDNVIRDYSNAIARTSGYNSLEEIPITAMCSQYRFELDLHDAGFETLGSIKPIIDFFKSLPLYKDVYVTDSNSQSVHYVIAHAWFSEKWRGLDLNQPENTIKRDEVLWFRDVDDRTDELLDCSYDGDGILIHGHTPTLLVRMNGTRNRMNEIIRNNNTINIDCGCVFGQYSGNLVAIRLEDQAIVYANRKRKVRY